MASRPTHLIDAKFKTLGRLSTEIALLLRGKNKLEFTQNQDCGDQVVVFNVDKIRVTGRKMETKKYRRHSGYIGNLKEKSLSQITMTEALKNAVYGMLPSNKLRPRWFKRLKIYSNQLPQREAKSNNQVEKYDKN